MISLSPLRYPGGKSRFTTFIWDSMILSGEKTKLFVEPFCGGSAVSIGLLNSFKVQQIALNDSDPLVANFWKLVFGKGRRGYDEFQWLLNKVQNTPLTTKEWQRQKNLKPSNTKEAAWKCLFLNRTSFNGILYKAGPIGGWEQKNRALDVRFNRETLTQRLLKLHDLKHKVLRVNCEKWQKFTSFFRKTKDAYFYFDPPYFNRANKLYGDWFAGYEHEMMRDYLVQFDKPWMLSYDDAVEIRYLYEGIDGIYGRVIDQTYSAHPIGGASFIGRELFYSNRPLPTYKNVDSARVHSGFSVLGCVNDIKSKTKRPSRTHVSPSYSV